MYEADDAIAKVGGYIISVVDAGRFVGQSRLVRIDEAGRTAAVATLLDVDEDEEAVESSARRRGRRGGRRRSAAKAAPSES
jgi:ribonuclease G